MAVMNGMRIQRIHTKSEREQASNESRRISFPRKVWRGAYDHSEMFPEQNYATPDVFVAKMLEH